MRSLEAYLCLDIKKPAMSECDDQICCSKADHSCCCDHTPCRIAVDVLQAGMPEFLVSESTGGLSHISRFLEETPFHGGKEMTAGMMDAFIPVAMKSLLKVWLSLFLIFYCHIPCTAAVALMPLAASQSSWHSRPLPVIVMQRLTCTFTYLAVAELLSACVEQPHRCSVKLWYRVVLCCREFPFQGLIITSDLTGQAIKLRREAATPLAYRAES